MMKPKLSQFLQDTIARAVVIATPPDAPPDHAEKLHKAVTLIVEHGWLEGFSAGVAEGHARAIAALDGVFAHASE